MHVSFVGSIRLRLASCEFVEPTMRGGVANDVGSRAQAEFLRSTRLVGLNGLDADVELTRDFLVAEALRR